MTKKLSFLVLALAGVTAIGAGGYVPDDYEAYSIEIFADEHEGYVYYSAPVHEVHLTLEEPGEAWVYTRKVGRNGQTYEAKFAMYDEGDGLNFNYSYSPAIVYAVEYTGRASYYRADRH